MTPGGQGRVIFVSYAHEDVDVLVRLRVMLAPLVRKGHVEIWPDDRIGVGRRWDEEIESSMRPAEVAVLLVSADFLASYYIKGTELPRLAERGVPLVSVPVGHCAWRDVEAIAAVQWPLAPEKPLRAMRRAQCDSALVRVDEAVKEVVTRLDAVEGAQAGPTIGPRPAGQLDAAQPGPLRGRPPSLPAGYQPRPSDLAELKQRLPASADVGLVGRQHASGLHDQGGVGKSVLAAALCHDPEVRSWFPDGICWVSVGESAELTGLQRQLARHFDVELGATNLLAGLGGRRCLVVVDDVWSIAAPRRWGPRVRRGGSCTRPGTPRCWPPSAPRPTPSACSMPPRRRPSWTRRWGR